MLSEFRSWNESVNRSVAGLDYEAGQLLSGDPELASDRHGSLSTLFRKMAAEMGIRISASS